MAGPTQPLEQAMLKALSQQISAALDLREPAVRREQNKILELLGSDYKSEASLTKLTSAQQSELAKTLASLQTKIHRLNQGKNNQGLATPKVWRVAEVIADISSSTVRVTLNSATRPDPLSAALGGPASKQENHLLLNGHDVGIFNAAVGLQASDLTKATRIGLGSGRDIVVLQTPAPLLLNGTPVLMGGYSVSPDGKLEQSTLQRANASIPGKPGFRPILLPVLRTQQELEGFADQVLLMSSNWGLTIELDNVIKGTLQRAEDVADLSAGRPTKLAYAMHVVASFTTCPGAGPGLSDGHLFVPLKVPTAGEFENELRHLSAFKGVSAEGWSHLIKALKYTFPRELFGKDIANLEREDVQRVINAEKAAPAKDKHTGCFHGYHGSEVQYRNAATGKTYLLFTITREGQSPVYVVDTPDIGAGYIFTDKNHAEDLATGHLRPSEVWEKAFDRIVHSGVELEWMARYDAALKALGVMTPVR